MSRTIIIKITDDESKKSISGSIPLHEINNLYRNHKINGCTQMVLTINNELNRELDEDIKILIPNELTILPAGKKW